MFEYSLPKWEPKTIGLHRNVSYKICVRRLRAGTKGSTKDVSTGMLKKECKKRNACVLYCRCVCDVYYITVTSVRVVRYHHHWSSIRVKYNTVCHWRIWLEIASSETQSHINYGSWTLYRRRRDLTLAAIRKLWKTTYWMLQNFCWTCEYIKTSAIALSFNYSSMLTPLTNMAQNTVCTLLVQETPAWNCSEPILLKLK